MANAAIARLRTGPGATARRSARHVPLMILLVGLGLLAAWGASGVELADSLRYLAYLVGFVLLPGAGVLAVVSGRRPSLLETVALGVPLGFALEGGAFVATAALDRPGLFLLYPVVVVALVAFRCRRLWGRTDGGEGPRGRVVLAFGGVCLAAIAYLGLNLFVMAPLPGDAAAAHYHADLVFTISMAAEAEHHWPLQRPFVSGHSLHYHFLVFTHLAGAGRTTGVDPAVLVLRLFPAVAVLVVAGQIVLLGKRVFASTALGVGAAGLLLLAGELDLDPSRAQPFAISFMQYLVASPSFLFSLPFFLALLLLFHQRLFRPATITSRWWWPAVVLLLVAAEAAKAVVVPVLLGGLVLYLAWIVLRERRVDPQALRLLVVSLAVFVLMYALVFAGVGDGGLQVRPLAFLDYTGPFEGLHASSRPLPVRIALDLTVAIAGTVLLLLPLCGIPWVRGSGESRAPGPEAWLLAVMASGLLAYLTLSQPEVAQGYFLFTAYSAGILASARGLALLWAAVRRRGGSARVRTAGVAVLAVGLAVAATAGLSGRHLNGAGWYVGGYGVVAVAVVGGALFASSGLDRRRLWAVAATGTLLAAGLTFLDPPLDGLARALSRNPPPGDFRGQNGTLAPDLLRGLEWIEHNSDADAVLAVNNHYLDARQTDPRFFYYSAFSERRVFLESWAYTPEADALLRHGARRGANPFPGRLRLNDAAVVDGDREALRTLATRYGVRYVVFDETQGPVSQAGAVLCTAFRNRSVRIYELPAAGPPADPRACRD